MKFIICVVRLKDIMVRLWDNLKTGMITTQFNLTPLQLLLFSKFSILSCAPTYNTGFMRYALTLSSLYEMMSHM